jgi:dihydrofolate synthase/folylpolyglutamate synthase
MNTDFSENRELALLDFVQKHYGFEIFTPGLDRTSPVFSEYIDLAQKKKIKVTIIAGTNGKGQTAHTLSYLLETAELSTAVWTSPHILSLRERFRFRGEDISYDELENAVLEAHKFLQKAHSELVISFYEFLFLVFLRQVFSEKNKDEIQHLILEVGLGGRLDAVNHFDADCTCITSISRDHQAILGSRYDQILKEKMAVGRAKKPLFTQFKLKYLNQLTAEYCLLQGIDWRPLHTPEQLTGNYFEENQNLGIKLFSYLEPNRRVPSLLSIPNFKGRREEMTFKGNTFIFIGAHNIDGVRRMIELFADEAQDFPSIVLLSFSKRPSNELDVMLKTLVDFFGNKTRISLTSFVHPKALEVNAINELESKFNKINKGLLDFVTDWKTEINSLKNQKVLVCGSYYFVGEVQRFILSSS